MQTKTRLAAASLAAFAGLALAAAAPAAVITNDFVTQPTVVANGNGSVSSITITNTPNNDNVVTANSNIEVLGKNFTGVGPIDIVFTLADTVSSTATEYFVGEGVTNNTGLAFVGYTFELGFGSGSGFVRSTASDSLDFDAPDLDPTASGGFATVDTSNEDVLAFSGGSVASGTATTFNFSIDVPNGLNGTFTLRQTPAVPEPATLGLAGVADLALLARRRRSA